MHALRHQKVKTASAFKAVFRTGNTRFYRMCCWRNLLLFPDYRRKEPPGDRSCPFDTEFLRMDPRLKKKMSVLIEETH